MKQRDAGHILKEEVKKKAMEQKPELIAVSPEDGKRHRWDMVAFRTPKPGDFYLGLDDFDKPPGDFYLGLKVYQYGKTHPSADRSILRDLGPAEEEKKGLPIIGDDNSRHQLEVNWKAACAEVSRLKNRVEELEAAVHSEHDKVISYRSACARYKSLLSTAEHSEKELRERLAASPAPCPVGVVRLPISPDNDNVGTLKAPYPYCGGKGTDGHSWGLGRPARSMTLDHC